MRVGFVVNPIAGMGGSVGLKGTDGEEILKEAIRRGAKPVSPDRAVRFLKHLIELAGTDFTFYTCSGDMGEKELRKAGYPNYEVVCEVPDKTSREDTVRAVKRFLDLDVDIVVFCGGDGTARDVASVVGDQKPCLGIPAGVKVYSAVFAVTPEAAAEVLVMFARGEAGVEPSEVMDIDEEAFRENRLSVRLYGYMKVPRAPLFVQLSKAPSPTSGSEEENKRAIARYVVERMKSGVLYILGPGTTVKAVADALGLEKTLLGVDAVTKDRLVARDVDERTLLSLLDEWPEAVVIVSPLGRQGFIFGRGNQQISAKVLRRVGRRNIWVIATRRKILELDALRVDTGDPELDAALRGYVRVITDYNEETVIKVI
ncbi:ATP-NAD kinase family protein [archaeon]|nr:ATP-NAD kinase family protein [archaeon]